MDFGPCTYTMYDWTTELETTTNMQTRLKHHFIYIWVQMTLWMLLCMCLAESAFTYQQQDSAGIATYSHITLGMITTTEGSPKVVAVVAQKA